MKNQRQKSSLICILLLLGLLLFFKPIAKAETSEFQGDKIKAAFLYNFANFVEWPRSAFADSAEPIILAVLGNNRIVEILNAANLKPIWGRRVETKSLERIEDIEPCHILFVDRSEKDNLQQILNITKSKSILTVSDMPGFAQEGGIINFIEVNKQTRFVINVQAAGPADLILSSKLLNLAMIISERPAEENE